MLTVVFFPKVEFVSVKGIQDKKNKIDTAYIMSEGSDKSFCFIL